MRLVNWLMSAHAETEGLFIEAGKDEDVRVIREVSLLILSLSVKKFTDPGIYSIWIPAMSSRFTQRNLLPLSI